MDSDNFGKNQTPLHRNGMADIPKISPLLDLLYGENQVTNSVDYSQHPNTATRIFSVHNSNGENGKKMSFVPDSLGIQ